MSISNFLWDAVSHFQTRLKVAHGGDWFKITSFSIADTHGSRLEAPLPNERGFGAAPVGQHKNEGWFALCLHKANPTAVQLHFQVSGTEFST